MGHKHVVSVSLGSPSRDHKAEIDFLGTTYTVERRGTGGDLAAAIALLEELDGKVDAFGMGGIDLYVVAGRRRYVLRDAIPLKNAPKVTPIVDGSGLKNTLERRVVRQLRDGEILEFAGSTVLMTAAVDRFGMAESLADAGANLLVGDLMFILGLPIMLRSLRSLDRVARVIGPIACRLPVRMLYPVGQSQEENTPKFERYFREADIIAGDYILIKRYMPADLSGKVVLTNTVTAADVKELARRGAEKLITTTPEIQGRSFGTNVMEALLVAGSGSHPDDLSPEDYDMWLDKLGFQPRVVDLAGQLETV